MGPPELRWSRLFGGESGVDEGFAVGDVAAGDDAEPEAAGHLFAGEVSPAAGDVALVLDFVVEMGFFHASSHVGGGVEVVGLEAGVGDPGARVVVHDVRVVDGAEMADRGRPARRCGRSGRSPGRDLGLRMRSNSLASDHQTLRIGGEARDDVAEIAVVGLGGHRGVAPAVVGMEEDEVGFDVRWRAGRPRRCLDVGEEVGVEVG